MSSTNPKSKPIKQPKVTSNSLALRLNGMMLGQNLSFMLVTQILVIGFLLFVSAIRIEDTALKLIQSDTFVFQEEETQETAGYQFSIVSHSFTKQDNLFFTLFPIDDAKRWIYFPNDTTDGLTRLMNSEYRILAPYKNTSVLIRYSLTTDLERLIWFLSILFVLQFLILLIRVVSNFTKVNNALTPLTQLTDSAVKLQSEIGNVSIAKRKAEIERFAGALNKIDVTQLDQPLHIQNEQRELFELTEAINDLLLRMNQAYQSQTRFVSDASHELRTPVAIIQGYANLLDRWGKDDPQTRQEAIDAIKDESEHMKRLIEQLLFLARGDSDTLLLQKENFDVNMWVASVVKEAQLIDNTHEYRFTPQNEVLMFGDKQLIKQVLRILLDNAGKYSPIGEGINISVSPTDTDVILSVADNGIGMDEETRQHSFDRFYRGQSAKENKTKGTGLGLSIAQWIVEKHDGTIDVVSRPEIGTKITIRFKQARVRSI